MKLKILFFPLTFIASLVIIIGFIRPEILKSRSLAEENRQSEEKLAYMKEKKDVVRHLDQNLSENSNQEIFLRSFLPENKNEEQIINALNYLAVSTGVVLGNISIEENKYGESNNEDMIVGGTIVNDMNMTIPSQSQGPVIETRDMLINISLSGKYENIKAFLAEMNKLSLMNSVKTVNIVSAQSVPAQGGVPAQGSVPVDEADSEDGVLTAEISSKFHYLRKIQASNNYNQSVLDKSEFNFLQVEKIKQFISQTSSALESGEKGNRNPFIAF